MKKPFARNLGFSLVEVMVSIGVISIVAIALTTMIEQSQKSVRAMEIKIEQVNFSTAFSTMISSNANCIKAFAGVKILPASLVSGASLNFPSDKVLLQGRLLSETPFEKFQNSLVTFKITNIPSANTADGTLVINLGLKDQFSSYLKPKDISIPFSLTVDPITGTILSCPAGGPPAGLVSANDCSMKIQDVPEKTRKWITQTCPSGTAMLFGTAFPDGSQDRISNLKVDLSSVSVYANRDSWKIIMKCCKVF